MANVRKRASDAFAELDREVAKLEKKRAAARAKAKKKPLKKVAPKKTGKVKPRKTTPKKAAPKKTTKTTPKKAAPKKAAPKRKVTKKVVSGTRTYDAKKDMYKYSGKTSAEKSAVRKGINKTERAGKRMEFRAAGYKGEKLKKMLANWEKNWSAEGQARTRRDRRKPVRTRKQYKKPIGPKPKKK